MSEQQNLEVVRRGYDAFGHGDIETLLSLFDEQIEWVTPGPAELKTSGRRTGRQAVGEFFGRSTRSSRSSASSPGSSSRRGTA